MHTQPSRFGDVLRRVAKSGTPLTRHLAGRRIITIWALLRYRGRRSGRDYTTPIAIGVTTDTFVFPMPFAGAQWARNVLAAGECTIRWNGHEHRAVEPTVIGAREAARAFGRIIRHVVPVVPVSQFLRLTRA